MRSISAKAGLLLLLAVPAGADLAAVRAEPNLERRSERALENANAVVTQARQEYDAGKIEEFKASVKEVQESIALALSSLEETGRSASRRPKYYKRAELTLHTLIRRIAGLEQDVGLDERPLVKAVHEKAEEVQEKLVGAIMEKKK